MSKGYLKHKDPNRLLTIGPNLGDYTHRKEVSRLEKGKKKKQKKHKDPNRLQKIGPNLGDYTQWVRLRAPTGRKVSRLEEAIKEI